MYTGLHELKDIINTFSKNYIYPCYKTDKINRQQKKEIYSNIDSIGIVYSSISILFIGFYKILKDIYFSFLTNTKKIYRLINYNIKCGQIDSTNLLPGDIVKIIDKNIKEYYDSNNIDNIWMIIDIDFHYEQLVFIIENMNDTTYVTGLLPEFCEFLDY